MERPYRSFFWPIVLIGAGVLWLLANLNIIQLPNPAALLSLWPLLLILVGIDLIFGRRLPWLGALLGLAILALVVVYLISGPQLGLNSAPQVQTEEVSLPVDGAESARLVLEGGSTPIRLASGANGSSLLEGEFDYTGELDVQATGESRREIVIRQIDDPSVWFQWWNLVGASMLWDINLSDAIDWDLDIDGGSGSLDLDLSNLVLAQFNGNFGSGSSTIILPPGEAGYAARIDSGSGSVNLTLPADTDLDLAIESGSGSVSISVPSGTAVHFIVNDGGSGSLNLPNDFERTRGSEDDDEGEWQTEGFDTAEDQITIQVDYGSGSVSLRYR